MSTDDPGELLVEAAGKAAGELANSEIAKALFLPPALGVGQTLGVLSDIIHFYTSKTAEQFCTKWATARKGKPALAEAEVQRILPLLALATTQSDEELQQRFVKLLEASLSAPKGVLPSFGQTLSQLSPEEARFLDRLWKHVSQPLDFTPTFPFGQLPVDYSRLIESYEPSIQIRIDAERVIVPLEAQDDFTQNQEALRQADLMIDDYQRLGLLAQKQIVVDDTGFEMLGGNIVPSQRKRTVLKTEYHFTQYGVAFMQAVTPDM